MKKVIIILIILFCALNISSKEAVLIFGGLFGNKFQMEKIRKTFEVNYGYDAYYINYLTRSGWKDCMENIKKSLSKIKLDEYEKVHIFCYIFGGRIVLDYFRDFKMDNLTDIVFDRGPIEEELAVAARDKTGEKVMIMVGGRSILEFSYKDHFHIPDNLKNVKIGIIVETKAIPICYLYKKEIKKNNPSFNIKKIAERSDDYFYIPLNHRQMYVKLNAIIPEIQLFFKNNKFSEKANRTEKNYLGEF